jgi:hypothetical protein
MRGSVRCTAGVVLIGFVLPGFSSKTFAEENGRVSADNYLYYAHDIRTPDAPLRNIFEDWATLTLGYGDFEANMALEVHRPPPGWSPDTSGAGIYERWMTWRHKEYSATIGNFYPLLGKGITLKSLWKRELRYNTNFDGVQCHFANRVLDITALNGTPRNLDGSRTSDPLQAAEVRVTPLPWGFAGVTYVETGIPRKNVEGYWGSGYVQLQRDFGSVYAEMASLDFGRTPAPGASSKNLFNGKGSAFYSTANLFVWNCTLLLETAYYNNFSRFNAPPPSVKEHSFALMGRAQPTFDADNNASMHADLTCAITDETNLSISLSRARAMEKDALGVIRENEGGFDALKNCFARDPDYRDIFLKGETVFPSTVDWVLGGGYQQSFEASYLNFVVNNDFGFADNYSMQGQFEHQLTTISLTKRAYYSQLYGISVSRGSAPRLSLGLVGEIVVKPETETKDHGEYWFGTQVNWTVNDKSEAVIFIGNRKEGKICSGGICVYKPEFSGVEVTVTSRF